MMNRRDVNLITALLLTMAVLLAPGFVKANTMDPGISPIENMKPNGEYRVFLLKDGAWQEAGALTFDRFFRERVMDLGHYGSPDETVKIRLIQKGGGAAHIDSVLLGGMPPMEVKGIDGEKALAKVSKSDYDVIDAALKTIDLAFPSNGIERVLKLKARVENETIGTTPFQFPLANIYKEMNEYSQFYTYQLNAEKETHHEAGREAAPIFREYSITGSGHPSGYTYGWVRNDNKNLYVTMDFTPDNTMDGGKDYAKVYAKTEAGLKEFKVSVPETAWGRPFFTYTDKVSYQHKVYEFVIPLKELGIEAVKEGHEMQLAFAAYGTALPSCGNGIPDGSEQCDDGNNIPGDGCNSACQIEQGWTCNNQPFQPSVCQMCGNGIREGTEECDDPGDPAECDSDCTFSECGDGQLNTAAGEECDDGNNIIGDGCDGSCQIEPICGNGLTEGTEECDNSGESAACDADCTFAECGDSQLNTSAGEECDDGNTILDVSCTPTCKIPEILNNLVTFVTRGPSFYVNPAPNPAGCPGSVGLFGFDARLRNITTDNSIFSELFIKVSTLTNGNRLQNADGGPGGAGSILTVPVPVIGGYSDEFLSSGEFTDVPFAICLSNFSSFSFFVNVWGVVQTCGNNIIEGTEECDDGNLTDGDNCDSNCTVTGCGNGIVTSGEECDDGNAVDDDSCSNNCTENICGNGRVDPGEECDDGNSNDIDGCRNDCTDVDECTASPCQNGGICTNTPGSYTCSCLAGFDGVNCENNIDECASNPCQNGGTCTDGIDSYTCECPAGFTGTDCENDIDECTADTDNCDVNAACTNTPGSFTCECNAGYTGDGVICTPDANGICEISDPPGSPDCDGYCGQFDEPGSPDCDGNCGQFDQPGSPDCDGFCDGSGASPGSLPVIQSVGGDEPGSPDCDGYCNLNDGPGSPDCDGNCGQFDESGSPDCDGNCGQFDESGSTDCNGICQSGEEGSPDCDYTCQSGEDGSTDCNGICEFFEDGSPDCNGICESGEGSSPDCDSYCQVGEEEGSPDCDTYCNLYDEAGSPDCDSYCQVGDEAGSPDCNSKCEFGELVDSPDCNNICELDEEGPDCDGICNLNELPSSPDCDFFCNLNDELNSPDCDGSCGQGDETGSPDCDGICESGEGGSPDCNGLGAEGDSCISDQECYTNFCDGSSCGVDPE